MKSLISYFVKSFHILLLLLHYCQVSVGQELDYGVSPQLVGNNMKPEGPRTHHGKVDNQHYTSQHQLQYHDYEEQVFTASRKLQTGTTSAPSSSMSPTTVPSDEPSTAPSEIPSVKPSISPSEIPSDKPSRTPSDEPSLEPSGLPSDRPTRNPSSEPSISPTGDPTSSIKPSPSPSARPTGDTPSPTPKVPTSAPFVCKDSSLDYFMTTTGQTRSCDFVKQNPSKIESRCSRLSIQYHCPVTCGKCSECQDSGMRFFLDNGRKKSCAWVRKKPVKISRRCAKNGVRETCRKTCSACS